MKPLLLTLALFVLIPQAQAKPHWKRIGLKLAVAGAAAGIHAAGLHHCRQFGVERCDGKYGESWAIFGIVTSGNLVMIPISEKIGGVEGNVLSFGYSGAQLGHGVYEWRKDRTTHVDLSHVALVKP